MMFNIDKCKVMHNGKRNLNHSYKIEGQVLKPIDDEKNFGIIISSYIKVAKQCDQAYNKASSMLGIINRTICNKRIDIMLCLQNHGQALGGILYRCLGSRIYQGQTKN